MMTATRLLLILQMILYHMTAANYSDTSEVIHFSEYYLSGFRNVTNKDFILGGLFPVFDCANVTHIDVDLLEAMLFAIDRINNDANLLPDLTIGYDVRDTCIHEIVGFSEALNIYRRSRYNNTLLLGIIGPAADHVTLPTANFLGLYQIPTISYASSGATLSNKNLYKYFLRTVPSSILQANAMADLVSHFEWHYVSVIFNDDYEYGEPGSDEFIDVATQHGVCVDVKIGIPPLEAAKNGFNKSIEKAAIDLINSTATVVVVFADEVTVLALFNELRKTISLRRFVWIASDRWIDSVLVRERFPEIAERTLGFRLHTEHVQEFVDYFSELTPRTNIRNPFFREPLFLRTYCTYYNRRGYYCPPRDMISHKYTVPLVIDAVYAFAHAIQNFLDNNCNRPFRWDHTIQQCDGMKYNLTARNLLGYIFNASFIGIQNRNVSFDENGDPRITVYEIIHLQESIYGQVIDTLVGFWDSRHKENALILTNTDGLEEIVSRCSSSCGDGFIRSITNQNCPSCFECIPCVGPTYSMSSSNTECYTCPNNHWGNKPLLGSTHCLPVKVTHLDFTSGWSIAAICIAGVALIILVAIIVILVLYWKTPVVKSADREQMIMLLVGIGVCCILTFVVVAPPSTAVCVFQRIGVWFCFSLAFGALLIKIIRVARIFYSIRSSNKRPPFTGSKYQVMFTIAIVIGQMILVAIGLGVDPPVVERDPNEVVTSAQQTGNAPEIVETCQQPHTAITVLLLIFNFFLIIGCTVLGWMTRKFPENFNEAKHVMFTSFTLMVVWVLFGPLYFSTEDEFQTGVLALGIVLSAIAVMAGVFFPRIFIIIFQKHKNTKEFVSQQSHTGATDVTNFSALQRNLSSSNFIKQAVIPPWSNGKSPDKGNMTGDTGVGVPDVKTDILEEKNNRPESNADSSA